MPVQPLPPREPDDESWPDSARRVIERNFQQLASDVRDLQGSVQDLQESDRRLMDLVRGMGQHFEQVANDLLAMRQAEVLRQIGQHRDRAPTLPEIVAAVQSGSQPALGDSERVKAALARVRNDDDAKTLRKIKGAGWKLAIGFVAAIMGVLGAGFGGWLLHEAVLRK